MTKVRVLIVDDDVALAQTLSGGLRLLGYEPMVANDAHSAFVLLRSHPFDVILSDIQIPDLSGFTIGRVALGAHEPRGIIFMTGLQPARVAADVEKAGGKRLLTKPFRLAELRAAIDDIMAGSGIE